MKQRRREHDGDLCNCLSPPIWILSLVEEGGFQEVCLAVSASVASSESLRVEKRGRNEVHLFGWCVELGAARQLENRH